MENFKSLGGKIWTLNFKILTALFAFGLILLTRRFLFGLGSVTALNDGYPWGLWIVYDVVTGTAIACGGYAMALLVYILNRQKYHPLLRSALVASMFGYTLAGLAIFVDVGRYWQLYNIFLPAYGNVNSVMFEVALCISLYILIMWLEFSPVLFNSMKLFKIRKIARKLMVLFIGLGVLLPTMHQSSLGSLMIVAGEKLSPLWQTMYLPLLFLITAIMMGYAIVVFESLFSSVSFKRPLELPLLADLSKIIAGLIAFFLLIRFAIIIWNGKTHLIFAGDLNSIMFLLEIILFLIPVVLLFSRKRRNKAHILFISAVSALLAGALYRFDIFLVAFNPGHGYHYFPSFQEIMATICFISLELMLYLIFIKRFPVMSVSKHA